MPEPVADPYAAAFDARCAAAEGHGTRRVDGLGIHGLVPVDSESPTQLLVLDDRAFDVLSAVLPLASAGTVRVYAAARRCAELLQQDSRWSSKPVTAMVCQDLRTLSEPSLPAGLSLRAVRRVPDDPSSGVPLIDAVTAAERAAEPGDVSVDELVTYLTSLPRGSRIFAAVDGDGVVRGTSASRTFLADACVFFVNTDPDWRRRGVVFFSTSGGAALRGEHGGQTSKSRCERARCRPLPTAASTAGAEMTQFSRTG